MLHLNYSPLKYLSITLLSACIFTACQDESHLEPEMEEITSLDANDPDIIPGEYIVVFKEDFAADDRMKTEFSSREDKVEFFAERKEQVAKATREVLAMYSISEEKMDQLYSASVTGFAARLESSELQSLQQDDRVAFIEPNKKVQLEQLTPGGTLDMPTSDGLNVPNSTQALMAQSVPWGISRVGSGSAANINRWAWVIDSGIQLDHPDLRVNTSFSRSFVSGHTSPTDGNGHGTHVAGTIGARNNNIGVVGVAHDAMLVAIRVFGPTGGSSNAVIIAGVDYVAANAYAEDVANMSLGGPASTALDNAVKSAASRGVFFAVAAGNEAQHARNVSPARASGGRIYTVSAMDINDRFASFSNFGNPPVRVCNPGVNINSTWINSGYRSISGTSMATPHIAGILLLNRGTIYIGGYVQNDPDGTADPIGVLR